MTDRMGQATQQQNGGKGNYVHHRDANMEKGTKKEVDYGNQSGKGVYGKVRKIGGPVSQGSPKR